MKYVIVAAGVGGATLLGGQLLRLLPKEDLSELNARENALLQSNTEIHGLLARLRTYGRFDRDAYRGVLDNALALIVVSQSKARISMPRKAAHYIGGLIDNVRVLRAHTKARFPGVLSEFDEVAAGLQSACTGIQHNITMSAQCALSS